MYKTLQESISAKKELENKRNERSTSLSLVAEGYTKNDERLVRLSKNVYHDDEDGEEDVEIQVLDAGDRQ